MEWETIAHGYGLAEAPTIDTDGALLFSDVLGGGIYRLTSDGTVTTIVPKRRGVGGITLHADGGIVCSGRDVIHVTPNGDVRTILHVDGVAGWNDIAADHTGSLYAGSLRFAVFLPDAAVVPGEVWVAAHGDEPHVVVDDVMHANGIAHSPDERVLYISDTRRQCLIAFDTHERVRRVIDMSAYGHPDGMAVDEAGAIWLALVEGGVARFTPEGLLDKRLEPPSKFVTSVCFDGRDLYVTTGGPGTVLATTVGVAGAPVAPARC